MASFKCPTCPLSFGKKSQKDQHQQREHQMRTVVKFSDGRTVEVLRNVETREFGCPVCHATFKWPKAIQKHGKTKCTQPCATPTVNTPLKIIPDDRETPSLLRAAGIFFNTQVKILICNSCQYCIGTDPKQVRSHITRLHSYDKTVIPSDEQLRPVLISLNLATEDQMWSYVSESDEAVTSISGLPIYDGQTCRVCSYSCCSKDAMQRHLKLHIDAPTQPSKLQTFFRGAKKRFFRVSEPASMTNGQSVTDELNGELHRFNTFVDTVGSSDFEEKLIPPIFRQFRWHQKLPRYTDCPCTTLISMCRLPKASEIDANVHAAISSFFAKGLDLLFHTPYLTRRYIIAGGLDVINHSKGFSRVEDATEMYQKHMTKLIHMVAECYEKSLAQTPIWKFSTSEYVESAVIHLRQACENDMFDPESDQVQDRVLKVLEAIFVLESKEAATHPRDDFIMYTAYRYVVCSSILGGEIHRLKAKEPSSITSICAGLVYWARLYTLVCVASKPVSSIEESLHFICDGVPTCFNALLEIMKLGKNISGPREGQKPLVHWIDNDMTSLVCKTSTVTAAQLQNMAKMLVSHVKRSLQESLFRGFNTERTRQQIESMHFIDDVNAKLVGTSFLNRPENQFLTKSEELLAFLSSTTGNGALWDTTVVPAAWNIDRVRKWLLECDEFMDDFIILMHLTFGQPARASELATFRLRDGHLEFRSVYAIRDRFSTVQMYHKSMNVTGKFKPIARFAPSIVNTDIILYFSLIRPVQAYLFSVAFPDHKQTANTYLDYLFVKSGRVMKADHIRRSIAKGFARFSDIKLDVSTYRHVAVAFIDPHFREVRFTDDLLDEQAGHSRETASTIYARGSNDPSALSRDQLHSFWMGSLKWHHFLDLVKEVSPVPPTSIGYVELPEPDKPPPECNRVISAISKLEAKLDVQSLARTQAPVPFLHPPVTHAAFERARKVVGIFTNSTASSFRSVEQGIALALILSDPLVHRLIVLPTGGGKSLLYMAHFIDDPQSINTSIVVVPTVALLSESVLKTKLRNIECCKYSSELHHTTKRFSIIFASAEQIQLEDFRAYVTLLQARKQLHCMFVDEAHLVVTASSYRPQMLFVPTLTEFQAPLVLLSATVPVRMENTLKTLFRVDFQTIRSQTNRNNISYSVTKVADLKNASVDIMRDRHQTWQRSRDRCIVYCATRAEVDDLCQLYKSKTGRDIAKFHAGMSLQEQSKEVAHWKSGKCVSIVATTAFGVGIDYPSVRLILHVGISWSILDYAQETGRAGRDGSPSQAITLTNHQYQTRISKTVNDQVLHHYTNMTTFLNDTKNCRRQQLQCILDGYGLPCIVSDANERCDVCKCLEHGESNFVGVEHTYNGESEIERTAQIANRRNANDRIIQGVIQEFFNDLPPFYCPICWIEGRSPNVDSHQCDCFRSMCFKCQHHDHFSTRCPNKITFQPGTCYLCGLPWIDLAGIGPIHPKEDFDKCSHPGKHFVIGAAWAAFHRNQSGIDLTKPDRFVRWLPMRAETSAFSNLILLFYRLVKARGPTMLAPTTSNKT